jgi:hypothetical protein
MAMGQEKRILCGKERAMRTVAEVPAAKLMTRKD